MQAIITVGLGFGDEGKGATVDHLTREMSADLVVRYSGGAQAGHNVVLSDGRRHTFSQFGAGTFAGARTFLGPRMIISPATMVPEADHLRTLGVSDPWSMMVVHPDCLVATFYHVLMNRLREVARGKQRHGSCGLGIGEARHYWLRYGQDAVTAGDLHDRTALVQKMVLLRERLLLEMQDLPQVDKQLAEELRESFPAEEADDLRRCAERLEIDRRLPRAEGVIFEGAQGVLLDEWYGFHPHTTWSTVTPRHAFELLADVPDVEPSVLGITRAYTTRHGAGPFPTACQKMTESLADAGNPHNPWQGRLRSGPLDLMLIDYAVRVAGIDGIVVNHLDQLPPQPRICSTYEGWERIEVPGSLQEQEELGKRLAAAKPVETTTTEHGLLSALASIAPVVGSGRGASRTDYRSSFRVHAATI